MILISRFFFNTLIHVKNSFDDHFWKQMFEIRKFIQRTAEVLSHNYRDRVYIFHTDAMHRWGYFPKIPLFLLRAVSPYLKFIA